MRRLLKESRLRKLIREEIQKTLNEQERAKVVRKFKELQRKYGEDRTISAFFEDFGVGRIKTALDNAEEILDEEKQKRRAPGGFIR